MSESKVLLKPVSEVALAQRPQVSLQAALASCCLLVRWLLVLQATWTVLASGVAVAEHWVAQMLDAAWLCLYLIVYLMLAAFACGALG